MQNDCYTGFGAKNGAVYNASVYARGSYDGEITAQVIGADGAVIGEGSFSGVEEEFKKHEFEVEITGDSYANATYRLVLSEAGAVELDMISLIPQQTFNGRDNGLRADLVEKLAELEPGFMRFPGGCIIEGWNLDNRYQWKQSVGAVEQRVQNWNRWQTHTEYHEGNGMYGYCQTYGLGFYEYFLLCEDIGAAAVPVVNVGIGCQYQTGDFSSRDELYSIYIQDALDLIEFANGESDAGWESIDYSAVDTNNAETFNNNWANLRALMGHPESFNMEYLGVGNEQWDTSDYNSVDDYGWSTTGNNFFKRYEAFEEEIHALYPDMKLIGTSGPSSDGTDFDKAWSWLEAHNDNPNFTYAVDEHYYRDPDWYYQNNGRYDIYDRDGFAVFAGEYASRWWSDYPRGNTLETAISEAAYLTGIERNSDIVKMASYAPLFAKEGATQWTPDLIWFNTQTAYASPDYYVQQMFADNSGDYNVQSAVTDKFEHGYAGYGTWATQADFRDFKVVDNVTGEDITPTGWMTAVGEPEKYELTAEMLTYSSEPEAANPAASVIDGSTDTRWASQGRDQWLEIDLGEERIVGKVGVATFNAGNGRSYYYSVLGSADGEEYEEITAPAVDADGDGEADAVTNGADHTAVEYTLAGNKAYRYIKVLAKGNSYHEWNGITEIEVYGECVQDVSMTSPGTWVENADGSYSQTSNMNGAFLYSNSAIYSGNYTITFKATKTGGDEGFLIPVMVTDQNNYYMWNIGGWSNTMSAFQKVTNGSSSNTSAYVPTVIETGREYEVKIVYNNGTFTGFLDGEGISQFSVKREVYANSVYDSETGDVILKLVNTSAAPKNIPVEISSDMELSGTATEYILTGESLGDKNSADEPENVAPVKAELQDISEIFDYKLPALSVAVLRIHTNGKLAVTEVDSVFAEALTGELPSLPETVDVTLSDGSAEARSVKWTLPTAGTFANPGEFKVYGRIEGTEVNALAYVTITDGDAPVEIISVNKTALMAGEETTVSFNPTESGNYMGIIAVYNGDILESADTVEFSGTSKSVSVQLGDLSGKTVKLMLWTDDGLVPVTEAVTVR